MSLEKKGSHERTNVAVTNYKVFELYVQIKNSAMKNVAK